MRPSSPGESTTTTTPSWPSPSPAGPASPSTAPRGCRTHTPTPAEFALALALVIALESEPDHRRYESGLTGAVSVLLVTLRDDGSGCRIDHVVRAVLGKDEG